MINIIPMPNNMSLKNGKCYIFRDRVLVKVAPELKKIRDLIDSTMKVRTYDATENCHLEFIYDPFHADEVYSIETFEGSIKVTAGSYSGAFYALMTLRQLFACDTSERETLIGEMLCIKKDSPKYRWRGLHLDESRHFFGMEAVKKLLDFMSLHKLNRFHWHLTDDQGWRVEIRKYPLLTEIGSYRKGSQLHSWNCPEMDNTPHSGFYTQQQIKEIVSYAKDRCIEIIPEIDFPAHCAPVFAAYNDMACRSIPCEVLDFYGGIIPKKRGIKNWNRTLCLGKDEVISFVCDIIDEVSELFPFEYFHVGGDEAPHNEWKECPACQKRIKDENLKDEYDLQGWFTNKVNTYLKSKGKTMVGWNEILASKLTDHDIVAQYWTPRSDKNIIPHIEKGGNVILSCHKNFYFDMHYNYCTVHDTYSYEPSKSGIGKEMLDRVFGIEGELWTEWIPSEKHLHFMLFNRSLALSENAWTLGKNYGSFTERLQNQKKIMDTMDFYYGFDFLTMKKNTALKKYLSKANGFTMKHNDAEFRLNEIHAAKEGK